MFGPREYIPELINPSKISDFLQVVQGVSSSVSKAVESAILDFEGKKTKKDLLLKICSDTPKIQETELFGKFPCIPLLSNTDFQRQVTIGIRTCLGYVGRTKDSRDKQALERQLYGKDGKNLVTVIERYINDIDHLFTEIINTITLYLPHEDSEKITLLLMYFKEKYKKNNGFSATSNIEMLDILLMHYDETTQLFFGCIPFTTLEGIIKVTILKHILNIHLCDVHIKRSREISYIIAYVGHITSLGEAFIRSFSLSAIITPLLRKEKISEKSITQYHESQLYKVFQSGFVEITHETRENTYYPVAPEIKDMIHQLIFSGGSFLLEQDIESGIMLYLLGLVTPLKKEKREAIVGLTLMGNFKKWSINTLLIIFLLDIEKVSWLSDVSEDDISQLADMCLEKKEDGKYESTINMSIFSSYCASEIRYIISLGKEAVLKISQEGGKKEAVFGVKKILEEVEVDKHLLFPEHSGYTALSLFINNTPRVGLTGTAIEAGKNNIYQIHQIPQILEIHRYYIQRGYSPESILLCGSKIHTFLRAEMEFYPHMLQAFLGVQQYILEKFLEFLPTLSPHLAYSIIQDNLMGFGEFLSEHDLWGQDMTVTYDLYCEKATQNDTDSESTIQYQTLSLISVFGEDIGTYITQLGFGNEILKSMGKLGEMMHIYFHDAFFSFLIQHEKDIQSFHTDQGNFLKRLQILQDILYMFENLEFRILQNPEKLFEFILLQGTITQEKYIYLQSKIPELELRLSYPELLAIIMKFLKYGDTALLELQIVNSESENRGEIAGTNKKKIARKKGCSGTQVLEKESEKSSLSKGEIDLKNRLESANGNVTLFRSIFKEIESYENIFDIRVYASCIISAETFGDDILLYVLKTLKNRFGQARGRLRIVEMLALCKIFQSSELQEEKQDIWKGFQKSFFSELKHIDFHNVVYILFSLQGILRGDEKNMSAMMGELEKRILEQSNFGFRDIYMMLTCLGFLVDTSASKNIISLLFSLLSKMEIYNDIDAICARRIYALHSINPSEKHIRRYEHAMKASQSGAISLGESFVYKNIKSRNPTTSGNYFLDGYEMDIFIQDKRLNIEIDGNSHTGFKKVRDMLRDRYLKERYGITTIRLSASLQDLQKNIQSLLNLIDTYQTK